MRRLLLGLGLMGIACGGGSRPGIGDGGSGDASADTSMADVVVVDGGDSDAGAGECVAEICDNGLDDDCDSIVEEGCACAPGEEAGCFRGPLAARGTGACADGVMICEGVEFGMWAECVGDVLPAEEVCDPDGIDEDCDGASNEGCECDPAVGPVACGSDEGACTAGTQECIDGVLGACIGATGPVVEACNGLDDDCDAMIDEALARDCGTDVGECSLGSESCVDGAWGTCEGAGEPRGERCNGLDDDCDGMVDESLVRACGSAVGACTAGMQSCADGAWSMCSAGTLPSVETCNDIDDDCDASTDEGISRGCGSSTGECSPGIETCSAGSFGACTGGTGPATEVCEGSRDEDCDGTVDEGCACTSGTTRSCGTGTGACVEGTQLCSSGSWNPCMGNVDPVPEVCNMMDDDCDGSTDEMGICPTSPPIVSCGADIVAQVLDTVSLSASGSDPDGGSVTWAWTVTMRPGGSVATPMPPNNANTTLFLDASGDFQVQACATDDEGEMACCTIDITAEAPGAIHVELSWDTEYGDVDLHLLNVTRTAPDGFWTADDCYFANPGPDWGPAGVNANPTLDRDDQDGFGPENITIDVNPASGTYSVGVHYYCHHSLGGGAAPGEGPTTATARVFCDGNLVGTYAGINLDSPDDWNTIAEVDYPSCASRRVDDQTNGSTILPMSLSVARHCEISCMVDSDCPNGERCTTVAGGGPPRLACVLDR